jgi:hypothetical protein
MSKPAAQQSAFKQLFTEILNQGGDFSKVNKDLKRPLKCYVKESYPYFLVTDGYFFVQAHFTKEAVAEFRSKFANVNITDLHDRVIVLNNWALEMRTTNSADVFTSYANLEVRLVVNSFKPNLNERLNPTRYPINLFRDDEMKTQIQQFRHSAIQASLAKNVKGDSLPDISKVTTATKNKVEGGIVRAGTGKGEDFSEFSFKEGNTAVVSLKDIYVQEKGKDGAKAEPAAAVPKVKGGAKGKGKAASKSAAKAAAGGEVRKSVDKVIKYTPSKSQSKKETPQKAGKVSTSAKKSTTGGKKAPPAHPSPSGKKSTKTTDQMTMAQFKKYLDWHEQKKKGGKVLGKRSTTGKASAASGKASKAGKRSKK